MPHTLNGGEATDWIGYLDSTAPIPETFVIHLKPNVTVKVAGRASCDAIIDLVYREPEADDNSRS